MEIVVCLKQVPDTAQLKFDTSGNLIEASVAPIINPFCEYALETAVRLKEATEGATLTAITVGPAGAKDVLKRAVALGADNAILVETQTGQSLNPLTTAHVLAQTLRAQVPGASLVLLGQVSSDGMNGITGVALAELLDWPSLSFCKNANFTTSDTVQAQRETETGIETVTMALPGVLTTMKCDYEPRIPSIKGVMKANRAEIMTLGVETFLVEGPQDLVTQSRTWKKAKKQGGQKIDGSDANAAVAQLMGFLQEQHVL